MSRLLYLLKLLIAGGLIWWLVDSGKLDLAPLAAFQPLHLCGLAVFTASLVPQVLRWWWLLRLHQADISPIRVGRWVWIGEFFTMALPGGAGAEVSRLYYVFKHTSCSKTAAISTMVLDRVLGLGALLLLGSLAYLAAQFSETDPGAPVAMMGSASAVMFLGLCAAFLAFGLAPVRRMFLALAPGSMAASARAALEAYLKGKRVLFRCFGVSVLSHLLLMGAFMVSGSILGVELGWRTVFLVVPLVFIANFLPLSPGGIGIGETAAAFLFAQFGFANGAAIMLTVRVWIVLLQLAGGGVYLLNREEARGAAAKS